MPAVIELSVHDRFMLGRRLAQAPEKVGRILNKTMLNIAIDMERAAKQFVPVVTARLQNSIWTERQDMRYTIQPNTVYAEWVHEGNQGIHIPASHRASSYGGNPFMTNAFEQVEPGARQELNAAVQDIIKSI
jgi:hypothetical protein